MTRGLLGEMAGHIRKSEHMDRVEIEKYLEKIFGKPYLEEVISEIKSVLDNKGGIAEFEIQALKDFLLFVKPEYIPIVFGGLAEEEIVTMCNLFYPSDMRNILVRLDKEKIAIMLEGLSPRSRVILEEAIGAYCRHVPDDKLCH